MGYRRWLPFDLKGREYEDQLPNKTEQVCNRHHDADRLFPVRVAVGGTIDPQPYASLKAY